MNPGLQDYYRPYGLPAVATVTVVKMPTAGSTVTVNGVVFTYGSAGWEGRTTQEVAQYLAAGINADRNRQDRHSKTNPIGVVWAMHYGNVVTVIASEPGTAGNSYTLATNASTEFTVSGATFSGGSAPVGSSPAITPKRVSWGVATFTSSGTPGAATVLSGTALWVRYAKLIADAGNAAAVTYGPDNTAADESVSPGLPGAVDMPANTVFNLATWYGKSSSASQVVRILYVNE